MGYWNKI